MKKVLKVFSIVLWILCTIVLGITIIDYLLVKNSGEPIFCLSHEVIKNSDGNTTVCNGILYKYYDTVGDGYISKKFIPIWKNIEDNHE